MALLRPGRTFTAMPRLGRNDLIQLAIGLVLAVTAFLPWYATDSANPHSRIDGRTGSVTPWDAHPTLRWVLLLVAVAALLSAWQTWHGQRTDAKRGEMSVVVAVALAGLVLVAGFVTKPGEPAATISLQYGWFAALALAMAGLAIALLRMPEPGRKPPGI
jgi:hypothetical protein